MLPHIPRSLYGKSYFNYDIIDTPPPPPFSTTSQNGTVNTSTVKIVFYTISYWVMKNDTVCCYDLHLNKNNTDIIDSAIFIKNLTKYKGRKWIEKDTQGSYTIYRFKRMKPSKWFQELNDTYFHADCELDCISWFQYSKEGKLKGYYLRIGRILSIAKEYD
jgi:hypothetical protein